MKKIVALPIAAALSLAATACSGNDAADNAVTDTAVLNEEAPIDNFTVTDDFATDSATGVGNGADIENALGADHSPGNGEAAGNAL